APPNLFVSLFAVQPFTSACRTLGGVAHLLCVRRLRASPMRTNLLALCSCLLTLFSAYATPPARADFVGTYEGASIRKSPTGQSFVLQLDVAKRDGVYSLVGSMNDTNR